MQALDFIKENVIFPRKEMLAYETLWAIRDIKEKTLREFFNRYTPSETLKEISRSKQLNLFASKNSHNEIKNKVDSFLKTSLSEELNTFSIVVNKNFQYPKNLINNYPIGLFYYKGNLDILGTRCISIVGTRKASPDGLEKAQKIAKELIAEKFTIVSGLAKGIDTAAHTSAIESKGNTIGVIGTPINEYYPKENKELQDMIAKKFLLISQVPFYRYANEPFKNRAYHFPRRNMTMASISEATIIVEASDTSGSLIQAKECLKQKKKLFILDSCFDDLKKKFISSEKKEEAIRVKNTLDILKHLQ